MIGSLALLWPISSSGPETGFERGCDAAQRRALRSRSSAPRTRSRAGSRCTRRTRPPAAAQAGHEVTLVSWSQLYPSALYPGEQSRCPSEPPRSTPFPRTVRVLCLGPPGLLAARGTPSSRHRPGHRGARDPRSGPRPPGPAARRPRRSDARIPHPRTILWRTTCCRTSHGRATRPARRALLSGLDGVLVHTAEQAEPGGRRWAPTPSARSPLPPHLPGGPRPRIANDVCRAAPRLIALGIVRPTRDSTSSSTRCPGARAHLTIAGELWGDLGRTAWPPSRTTRASPGG
jgi:hypothetical protein